MTKNLFGQTPTEEKVDAFLIILKDFADTLIERASWKPELIAPLLKDAQEQPDDWFKLWVHEMNMQKYLMIFATATNLLLKEYTSERIQAAFANQLKPGHDGLPADQGTADGGAE